MSIGLGLLTPRPARRSGWLASALSHHLGSDSDTVDNEVVVLATGIDQYLQEIFHHLNYEGDGFISSEDFLLLCSVLGLEGPSDGKGPGRELGEGQAAELPRELAFKDFHARLCGYFFEKSGRNPGRLPVGKETEHVERQIQLRCPRIRRRRRRRRSSRTCVSFDPAKDWGRSQKSQPLLKLGDELPECLEDRGEGCLARLELELELENASLRELVEDLRGSLQSSDARGLALEVALRKIHGTHDQQTWPRRRERRDGGGGGGEDVSAARQQVGGVGKTLLRELELIRSSRDGQINEAMRFNQQLEEELKERQGRLLKWEQWLREVRWKAEEARRALAMGLEGVRELESRARLVPDLHSKVLQLELELHSYRSQGSIGAGQAPASPGRSPLRQEPRVSSPQPSRGVNPFAERSEEHFLRAVEGRAASDEEEEEEEEERERYVKEQNHQDTELGRVLHLVRWQVSGSQSQTIRQILFRDRCRGNEEAWAARDERRGLSAEIQAKDGQVQELEREIEKLTCSMTKQLQLKGEEVELLRLELQMVETDRVRLSLVEEKLSDVLQLLQQLLVLNISRRALGRILLNTLNACYKPGHETSSSLDVLNSLSEELLSCELLSDATEERKQQQLEKNSLIISC